MPSVLSLFVNEILSSFEIAGYVRNPHRALTYEQRLLSHRATGIVVSAASVVRKYESIGHQLRPKSDTRHVEVNKSASSSMAAVRPIRIVP
jgi:hypothetical protein